MVKIMIDSAADIGKEEAEQLGIIMVPMIITFGEEDFYDGIDLNPTIFYEKLIESDVLPKTSLVNAFRWEEAIQQNLGADDEIIIITISVFIFLTFPRIKVVTTTLITCALIWISSWFWSKVRSCSEVNHLTV